MAEAKFYRCNHCGNIVAVVKDGGVTPSCCGEPMELPCRIDARNMVLLAEMTDLVGRQGKVLVA